MIGVGPDGLLDATAARRAGFVMDLRSRGVRNRQVLVAMELVPRAAFVAEELQEFAYADRALPIACGQTIEKPSVMGRILEALAVEPGQRVLEIGTGTGWTAAILAQMGATVVSLERYRTLAADARERLAALGVTSVEILHRDGLRWPTDRFHRVLVHGSVSEVPRSLREAVLPGGVLVVPVGAETGAQDIRRIVGGPGGAETSLGPMRTIPLVPGLARTL